MAFVPGRMGDCGGTRGSAVGSLDGPLAHPLGSWLVLCVLGRQSMERIAQACRQEWGRRGCGAPFVGGWAGGDVTA